MKNIEKEKLWLNKVKELSKASNWKFKSYFIFKVIDNLFFSANFFINAKENSISVCVEYKTFNIDNVFWDVIGEPNNKKMPISFRSDAAFCVRGLNFYEHKIYIEENLKPEKSITELLTLIDKSVAEKADKIWTLNDFKIEMFSNEKSNSVGIVTSLIEQEQSEDALLKIEEYKRRKISSGFGFGDKDFYDLAKEYCEKNLQPTWVLPIVGRK